MSYKPITIYTPETEEPHITADDDAFIYYSLLGGRDGIFGMTCIKIDNHTVQLSAGGCTNRGHILRVFGENNITLTTGTAGTKRLDFIVARFTKGGGETADAFEIDVIEGTPYTTTPSIPTLDTSDLSAEGDVNEVALYEIHMNGTNLESIIQDMPSLPYPILVGTSDPPADAPNGTIYFKI